MGVHSLDDGVDLVAPFGAFGFLAVEKHTVPDLDALQRSRRPTSAVGSNLIVEPAALWVSEHHKNILVHGLQELARARNRATSACHSFSYAAPLDCVRYTPAPETNASTCPFVCRQISGPVPSKCAS